MLTLSPSEAAQLWMPLASGKCLHLAEVHMTARKGIGGHQRAYRGRSDEWLTPPDLLKAIGPFDLDPCSPVTRPWRTARWHLTVEDDGLALRWLATSSIFLNPPYGPETGKWLKKLAEHGKG